MKGTAIDFDPVADLYDTFVSTDSDVGFRIDEARKARGNCLELMCGAGRIGLAVVEAGTPYTGLDYSKRMLDRFGLVVIGFQSLSEILDDHDKLDVLERCRGGEGTCG